MKTRNIALAGLVIFTSILGACSSATLKTSNRNSQFTGKLNKVYIVSYSQQQETRQQFEDLVAATLAEHGVTGISSYQALPRLREIDDYTLTEQISATGSDTLLLTVANGRNTVSEADITRPYYNLDYIYELLLYNPIYGHYPQSYSIRTGTNDHVPRGYKPHGSFSAPAFSEYYGFRDYGPEIVYSPENKRDTILISTYLFDTQTKKLLWSAEIEAMHQVHLEKSIKDVIDTVTEDLIKQGLI